MKDQMQIRHEEGMSQCKAMRDQEANTAPTNQRADDDFGVADEYSKLNPNLVLGDEIYLILPHYDLDNRWEQSYSISVLIF